MKLEHLTQCLNYLVELSAGSGGVRVFQVVDLLAKVFKPSLQLACGKGREGGGGERKGSREEVENEGKNS